MSEENGINIRAATSNDVSEYERLSDELVATEENMYDSLFGPDANAEAVFACYGNGDRKEVGCAVFTQHYSTYSGRSSLYLEDLFVLPEWRSYGVGSALMAYGAKLARSRDYLRMEWSVLDWNDPAIEFYESLGAVRIKGWLTYRISGEALERLDSSE